MGGRSGAAPLWLFAQFLAPLRVLLLGARRNFPYFRPSAAQDALYLVVQMSATV